MLQSAKQRARASIRVPEHKSEHKCTKRTTKLQGINIQMISTSEIKVSVVVAEKYLELGVRTLHTAFGLDNDTIA